MDDLIIESINIWKNHNEGVLAAIAPKKQCYRKWFYIKRSFHKCQKMKNPKKREVCEKKAKIRIEKYQNGICRKHKFPL